MVCVSPRAMWFVGDFWCDCMVWEERGGGLTRQPVDLFGDTATMTTVMNTNRVDSGSFSSRCCAFRSTHTSANPIRLLCIRQVLPLTLSLLSRFALWLVFHLGSYGLRGLSRVTVCIRTREEKDLLGNVGPIGRNSNHHGSYEHNRADPGRFSSRCCTFRRTHTSATLFG